MFGSVLLVFFCIFVAWLIYADYFKPYYILKKRLRLAGPPPKAFVGNYSEIAKSGYLHCMKQWMSHYGPTFVHYLGIRPVVATQDAGVIKSIMATNFEKFVNRAFTIPLSQEGQARAAITQLRDDTWRRIRHTMTPGFSSKKLKMMVPLIQKSCERLRDELAAVSDTDVSVDVCTFFAAFTVEVTLATLFNRDISSEGGTNNPINKAIASVFEVLSSSFDNQVAKEQLTMVMSHFPWSVPILRFLARKTKVGKNWDYLEETALRLIEDHRNNTTNGRGKDFLQMLLELHNDNVSQTSGYVNTDELIGIIVTIVLGAYETTNGTLGYTIYLLALNPSIQDRLIKEIKDYYDANPDSSLCDAAENIEYVTMVLSESLRMFPPVAMPTRECTQTCAVTDDIIIEKGTDVVFPIFTLHRDPTYWPDPDKFDPERFNPNNEQSYPTFAYIPFGEGPRACIGKRMVLLEVKIVLITIFRKLRFIRTADTEVPLDLCYGISMTPKNGIMVAIASN